MKTATMFQALALAALSLGFSDAQATSSFDTGGPGGGSGQTMPGVLQCVPYARDVSGIRIYGDAHT
jgi:hypothetical protein